MLALTRQAAPLPLRAVSCRSVRPHADARETPRGRMNGAWHSQIPRSAHPSHPQHRHRQRASYPHRHPSSRGDPPRGSPVFPCQPPAVQRCCPALCARRVRGPLGCAEIVRWCSCSQPKKRRNSRVGAVSTPSIIMATALEKGWLYLINNFTDFQLASIGSFIIHESVFFLSGLPFIIMERLGYQRQYKIQGKINSVAAQEKCVMKLLLYHICVNLPLMIVSYPVFKYMGFTSQLPLPSWNIVCFQILSYFILEDFIFYWGHRILHTKWLYKHVHSVHHEYATPFGLTSEYAHPAEILFLGFATIFGPAITGPHLLTLWIWMSLRVIETVEAHCGYDFPWSLSRYLPIYGGADFHDYHHRLLYTKSGNYSSTFTYMDWIFGTDKGYRKLKALKAAEHQYEYVEEKVPKAD